MPCFEGKRKIDFAPGIVPFDPGDLTVGWPGGTVIDVIE
jgi:hypothetical protein